MRICSHGPSVLPLHPVGGVLKAVGGLMLPPLLLLRWCLAGPMAVLLLRPRGCSIVLLVHALMVHVLGGLRHAS